jgi:16S rRNA (uracil1498-N3)-methyltransferase
MNILKDKHHFAFYTNIASYLARKDQCPDIYEIVDLELIHRIVTVVRLEKGDILTLFDTWHSVVVSILAISTKKMIRVEIIEVEATRPLMPSVQWGLPLLKREAFEEALYSLSELGVTSIQPLITQKTTKTWTLDKDLIRGQKILIAAAEQSKQFVLPTLLPVLTVESWLLKVAHSNQFNLFFDAQGDPIESIIEKLTEHKAGALVALSGPEGDFTLCEKELIKKSGFNFCKLTPTIVRAQQAVAIGLGILRSFSLKKE